LAISGGKRRRRHSFGVQRSIRAAIGDHTAIRLSPDALRGAPKSGKFRTLGWWTRAIFAADSAILIHDFGTLPPARPGGEGPRLQMEGNPMRSACEFLMRRKPICLLWILSAALCAAGLVAQAPADRCLVPTGIRDAVLNETSGEEAYEHVQILSVNRDRQAEEYAGTYFESAYIEKMSRQYGLSNVQLEFFPTSDAWDAEEADLWLLQPSVKKLASLSMVPTALAQGSMNADVEAEVIYVGQAREADFAGKDVKGKVVLGSGSVGQVFTAGMQRGAVGALGTGSAGVSANSAGYTLDQLGWSRVSPRPDTGGFGFVLSLRQYYELRDYLERGQKVVVKAHVRAKTYPSRMNVVSASIPGSDSNAGELILVAHAYETIATPGANDNCTGVATVLEVGRTLARLIKNGNLPQPKRAIRFVWGPEISGTTAFMNRHPELQDKLITALNFDMTGANLKLTDGYLRMKMTPDSLPSFLNDLMANLLQFVDQTEIRTQQGDNGQFNYRLCPVAAITSGSDHSVFNNGGVPAMQFNHWPDNFYHSSHDRILYVDPTELKRTSFMAAAAMYYLATAGMPEARALAWEAATNGQKWIAEVTRQSARLLGSDPAKLYDQYKAAQTKIVGAYNRARGGVESVLTLSKDERVAAGLPPLIATLEAARDANSRMIEAAYRDRCATTGATPAVLALTDKEKEYSLMVPRRLFKIYSEEAQKRNQGGRGRGAGSGRGQGEPAGAAAVPPPDQPAPPAGGRGGGGGRGGVPGLPGLSSSEINIAINGTRSILDIYNLVRAECGNLVIGNNEFKFAYVLSPDAPDVTLEAVATFIQNLEKSGVVEIKKLPPPAAEQPKKKK
jgi:aminopeptidase YwaD